MRAKESDVPPKTAMAREPPLSCSAVLIFGRLMSHQSEVAIPPAIITASAPLRLALTIDEPPTWLIGVSLESRAIITVAPPLI